MLGNNVSRQAHTYNLQHGLEHQESEVAQGGVGVVVGASARQAQPQIDSPAHDGWAIVIGSDRIQAI